MLKTLQKLQNVKNRGAGKKYNKKCKAGEGGENEKGDEERRRKWELKKICEKWFTKLK